MLRLFLLCGLAAAAPGLEARRAPAALPEDPEERATELAHANESVAEWIEELRHEVDHPQRRRVLLEESIETYRDHPCRAVLLIALAEELRRDPDHDHSRVVALYRDAAVAEPADDFAFDRQEALQHLAEIHERAGEYRAALAALEEWEVCDPCGTGAMATERIKEEWTYRLRAAAGDEEVFADLWREFLHQGAVVDLDRPSPGRLIAIIRRCYGEDVDGYRAALAQARQHLDEEGAGEDDRRRRALAEMEGRFDLERRIPGAAIDELVDLLRRESGEHHQLNADWMFDFHADPYEPRAMLVRALAAHGAAAARAIEASLDWRLVRPDEFGQGKPNWEGEIHGPLVIALMLTGDADGLALLMRRADGDPGVFGPSPLVPLLRHCEDPEVRAWYERRKATE